MSHFQGHLHQSGDWARGKWRLFPTRKPIGAKTVPHLRHHSSSGDDIDLIQRQSILTQTTTPGRPKDNRSRWPGSLWTQKTCQAASPTSFFRSVNIDCPDSGQCQLPGKRKNDPFRAIRLTAITAEYHPFFPRFDLLRPAVFPIERIIEPLHGAIPFRIIDHDILHLKLFFDLSDFCMVNIFMKAGLQERNHQRKKAEMSNMIFC